MNSNVFIISEIGINHNGDIDIAKKMIDISKKIGVDAVKFQKRDVDLVYSRDQLNKYRESPWGKTEREQKIGLEFNQEDYEELDNHCKQKKIECDFKRGERIKIKKGTFQGMEAIFLSKTSKDRVRLLLKFTNQLTTAQLPASDVGKKEIIESFRM